MLSSLSAAVFLVSPDSIDSRFPLSQMAPLGTCSSLGEERAIKRPSCWKRFYANFCIGAAAAAVDFSYFFFSQGPAFAGKTAYGSDLITYLYYNFLYSPTKEKGIFFPLA